MHEWSTASPRTMTAAGRAMEVSTAAAALVHQIWHPSLPLPLLSMPGANKRVRHASSESLTFLVRFDLQTPTSSQVHITYYVVHRTPYNTPYSTLTTHTSYPGSGRNVGYVGVKLTTNEFGCTGNSEGAVCPRNPRSRHLAAMYVTMSAAWSVAHMLICLSFCCLRNPTNVASRSYLGSYQYM